MSGMDILRKAGGAFSRTIRENPLESSILLGQMGLSGGAAAMAQRGYRQVLKRADRIRQLGAIDRQLAAVEATRRLSTIKASSASPGYASLGVSASYGSPVDTLMYAEAAEGKQLERLQMAHRYLEKDTIQEGKDLRLAGMFQAGQTLLGAASQYAMGLSYRRATEPDTSWLPQWMQG